MIQFLDKPYAEEEVFSILHPTVKRWFNGKFKALSLPQRYGVKEIHSRNNVLISAPTGATKTLTAFLSILNELVDSSEKRILENKVYAVYISPLKALNRDIQTNLLTPLKEMEILAEKEFGIRVGVRTGDTTTKEKADMLKNPPHILITTPESLSIMLASQKFIEYLKDVQWCIIDEVHALAENKRGVHLSFAIEQLQRLSPGLTRVGLSATVAPIEEIAKYLVGYEDENKKAEDKTRPCKIINTQFLKETDLQVLSPVKNLIEVEHLEKHGAMYDLLNKLIQEHKTTLIFTNTRSATERVVHFLKEKFPKNYTENIGAHHGSLSKEHRFNLEDRLKKGELKVVVCSTSLELGIDIGYIDLVILLGSPKSVARCLQRIGRSGHQLHAKSKGRIVVLDRDDLVECSVLLKDAIEKKIDKIHIPQNSLDVLAQQITGIVLNEPINVDELFNLIRQSYCYHTLRREDFNEILKYLSGEYTKLEDRHVYARIWYDATTGMIGKRGKLARVIYMTNVGTIPEESYVTVKIGEKAVGKIDEGFLERLRPGDVFLLGGQVYMFKYSRGMTAQVSSSVDRPPNVPSWFSEMLPLSFDLAMDISKFRRLMEEKFSSKKSKDEIIKFLHEYLYVDENAANSIYDYFKEQYEFLEIPHDKKIIVEHYKEKEVHYAIFQSVFGRRVNDCLSRAIAYLIAKKDHVDVEIGITDNGFYIASKKIPNAEGALKFLKKENLKDILKHSIDASEVIKRRFRHCATRSLMILRSYGGRQKHAGRLQMASLLLLSAVKRISDDFIILREARREIMEDLMDIENAEKIVEAISKEQIKVKQVFSDIPSPFSFNLILQGKMDMLKIEDKTEFLKKMHQLVQAKISLKKGKEAKKE